MFIRGFVGRLCFGAALLVSMLLATPAAASPAGQEAEEKQQQASTAEAETAANAAVVAGAEESDASGTAAAPAPTPQEAPPAGKFSGLMFGDYYYATSNHREDVEGQHGFWFRRIYFTYDHKLGGNWDMRFRVEGNSPGKFNSADTINMFVKDAYARWRNDSTSIYLGISSPPTFKYIEDVWGYRWLEKTPLDLQKFASSRDFGVAVMGNLGASKRLHYHVMAGNGSGTKAEIGKGKAFYASLRYDLTDELSIEGYVDYKDRDGGAEHVTMQGFAAYDAGSTRVGLQYARQDVTSETNDEYDLNLLSAFVVQKLSDKLALVVRADRMFDPNPDGEGISYLPFSSEAKSLLVLAGVDINIGHGIHLMPNFEWITYEAVDGGEDPGDDLMLRGTFYWSWG